MQETLWYAIIAVQLICWVASQRLHRRNFSHLQKNYEIIPFNQFTAAILMHWLPLIAAGLAFMEYRWLPLVLPGAYDQLASMLSLKLSMIAGYMCIGLGFALIYWAINSLGQLWVIDVIAIEGREMVGSGAYRHFNHPQFLGIALLSCGNALFLGSAMTAGFIFLVHLFLSKKLIQAEVQSIRLSLAFPEKASR